MKNLAIARRYAKALLLIGKSDGQAEAYRQELSDFTRLLERDPNLAQAINNPLYKVDVRRNVLSATLQKMGVSKAMASFLFLLFDKGRIPFITHINDFYNKMADELKGIARASLVSAAELPADTLEKIRTALSAMTRKEVRLDVRQDPALIGGIVTRIGNLVLDGSIRTQLSSMRESFKRENL